uniref:Putative effector protein n=1 Tax=Heterodera avenae TaxID=34510 RepID=A0A2L0VDM4_HETAV|nr:putative effector protein [Heterodera avenae]
MTPTPVMRVGSPASTSYRLSKEKIDEILDSPYETKYTYSDSTAYKPLTGSPDYVHPRLCRRFPPTQSSPLLSSHFLSPGAVISWNQCRCYAAGDNQQQQLHHLGKWLFYSFLLLLLLFAGYTLFGDCRLRCANEQPVEAVEKQINCQQEQKQLLKLKPSDEFHLTQLAHYGTPRTAIGVYQPELNFAPSLSSHSQPQIVYNKTNTSHEPLTKASQSVEELIGIDFPSFRDSLIFNFDVLDYHPFDGGLVSWEFNMSFSLSFQLF